MHWSPLAGMGVCGFFTLWLAWLWRQVKGGGRKVVARDSDGSHTASAASVANASPIAISGRDAAVLAAIASAAATVEAADGGKGTGGVFLPSWRVCWVCVQWRTLPARH